MRIESEQSLRPYALGWGIVAGVLACVFAWLFTSFREAPFLAVPVFAAFAYLAWKIAEVLGPRTRSYLNFGTLGLELHAPLMPGGELKGVIRLPRAGNARLRIDAELACLLQNQTRYSGGTSTTKQVVLSLKDVLTIQQDQEGRFAEVNFAIPATAIASGEVEPQADPRTRLSHVWELRLTAADPGGDLQRTFPLQVLPAQAQANVAAREARSSAIPSAVILVAANLVPLALVYSGKASVGGLVLIYWAENLVIGFYTVLRMLTARRDMPGDKLGTIPFFCVHYGLFCAAHGFFVILLFSSREQALGLLSPSMLLLPLAALFVSHGVSFVQNYLRNGRYLKADSRDSFWRPYPRMLLLHVAIIAGGFIIQGRGSPLPMLVGLIAGKTLIDLLLHRRANR